MSGLRFALIYNFLFSFVCVMWVSIDPDSIYDMKELQKKDPNMAKYKLEDLPRIAAMVLTVYTVVTTLLNFWFYRVCYKWANGPEAMEKKQFLR